MKKLLFIGVIFLSNLSFSYQIDEYQKYKEKYKGELAVVLNHKQTINASINKKTGDLDLFRTDYEEVLYLTKSSDYFTSRYINLSDYFQDITNIEVIVYNPKGKKYKLKPEDFTTVDATPSSWVFHDDDKEIVFDLKELGEGYRSIISYTKKLKKPEFFGVFDLISNYPLETSEIEINYPETVKIAFSEMNLDRYKVEKSTTNLKGINTKRWIGKDIEAFKREDGSLNIRYFLPQVLCRIESYQSNDKTHYVMSSVKDLHKYFQDFLLAKEDEKNRGQINRTVRDITNGLETDLEKIDTIFKWVQTNIKYIAFEDGKNGYVPRACTKVMKDRYGDCKDMGNLLVEMLTYAKVKNAHVAWVGTRDIPYQMSEFPSPLTCNHVICVVDKPEGGYYYLDATSSEVSYLIPTSSIQGKEILVHYGDDKFKLVKVEPVDAKTNTYHSVIKVKFSESDSLYGTGRDTYMGYQRLRRTYRMKNYDNKELDEYVKNITLDGYTKFTLKDYSIENLYNNLKPLHINFEFSFLNPVIKKGADLIINPDLLEINASYYFKDDYQQTQKIKYYKDKTYEFQIEIPKNYDVKYLPKNVNYQHELFDFDATFKYENGILSIVKHFTIKTLELPPSLFDEWNKFSDAFSEAAQQNVILTKKN
jgi:hypothetical protein